MRRLTRLPVRVLDALAMRFPAARLARGAVYVGDIASTPPPKTPPPISRKSLSDEESRPAVEAHKRKQKRIATALLRVTRPRGATKGD